MCYPHDYFQNFHNQGSVRMRFAIETKGHNIVPIFPSKHFVGTQPCVGETKRAIVHDDGGWKTTAPEATALFVDVFVRERQ